MFLSRLSHRRLMRRFICPLALLCLSACSVTLQANRPHPEIEPVPVRPGGIEGVWQGPDLQIAFRGRAGDASLHLDGRLLINDRLRYSFPVILSFFLELALLDGDGRIIAVAPVNIPFTHFGFAEAEYPFTLSTPLVGGAEHFTFRYSGTFSDYGERRPHREHIAYQPGG